MNSSNDSHGILALWQAILHNTEAMGHHDARITALERVVMTSPPGNQWPHQSTPPSPSSTPSPHDTAQPSLHRAERIASMLGTFWTAGTSLWQMAQQLIIIIIPRASAVGGAIELGRHIVKWFIGG